MVNGILNNTYDFFYNWLFGSSPVASLLPYAECITFVFSFIFVFACVWFSYKLVSGIIKLVYNFFV